LPKTFSKCIKTKSNKRRQAQMFEENLCPFQLNKREQTNGASLTIQCSGQV